MILCSINLNTTQAVLLKPTIRRFLKSFKHYGCACTVLCPLLMIPKHLLGRGEASSVHSLALSVSCWVHTTGG